MNQTIAHATIILIIIIVLWAFASHVFRIGFDSTDHNEDRKRSGLALYTDYATGVQYVKGGLFGGLSPRLNADGTLVNIYHKGVTK